jgi:glycosyltransferase involved in cell wall biosynthesis
MHTEKKRILVFSDWYLPGYRAGGPIRSLANLVNTLHHDFYIVTRNTDHHSTIPYPQIHPNTWTKFSDNVQVIYFEESYLTNEVIETVLKAQTWDKIYFNSLFSPLFTIKPLRLARKMGLSKLCVLAPRGMLKPGALSIKSKKKKLFLFVAKLTGLYNQIIWHATSEDEKETIVKHFSSARDIRIAPNLSDVPKSKPAKPMKQKGELRLICIARISPEKGIMEALKFLNAMKMRGDISCDFYGTEQNPSYLDACKQYAESIDHVHIRFKGEITPANIPETLLRYHFFYMTTWGENFGHAISEALTHATPVIISDMTPWRGLEQKHAGWDLSLQDNSIAHVLDKCLEMGQTEYAVLSDGAYIHGRQVALDMASIEASYKVFA